MTIAMLKMDSLVILDCGIVNIGKRVLLGPGVSIYTATHETDVQSRRDALEYAKGVTIKDDCWIGGNTTNHAGRDHRARLHDWSEQRGHAGHSRLLRRHRVSGEGGEEGRAGGRLVTYRA